MGHKIIAGLSLVLAGATCFNAFGGSPSEMLERAIYLEDSVGDTNSAIAAYRQIIEEGKANRSIVAHAYLRLVSALMKTGQQKEAMAASDELARLFPEQVEVITKAQADLAPYIGGMATRNSPESWFYFDGEQTQSPPCLVLTAGETSTLTATQGTTLIEYLTEGAYGALQQLSIAANDKNRVLLQFDLPAGSDTDKLTRAELILHVKMSEKPPVDPVNVGVYAVVAEWNEQKTSWMTQPGFEEKPVAVAVVSPPVEKIAINITSLVKQWMDGSLANHGLLLKAASPLYGPPPWDTSPDTGKYTAEEVAAMDVEKLFNRMIYAEVGRQWYAGLWGLMAKAASAPENRAEIAGMAGAFLNDKKNFGYIRWLCCYVLSGLGDKESVPLLQRVLQEDPDPGVREGAAGALGDYDDDAARAALEDAAKKEPMERVRLAIQEALSGKARVPAANRVYLSSGTPSQGGATDNPKLKAEELNSKGWAAWQARKLNEAEDLFRAATTLDPQQANAWNGLGWSLFNQGRPMAAKEAFLKCIELDARQAGALNGLGWIAKGEGKTDEAIGYWTRAIEAAPGATAAIKGITDTYMETGQYEKAAEYYEKWLSVEPQNSEAKAGLDKAKGAVANPASVPAQTQEKQPE